MCMSLFSPSPPSPPPPPPAPVIEPPKQPEKAPEAAAVKQQNRARVTGSEAGVGSTFLTGAGGVDPTQLALGKQTLLGG